MLIFHAYILTETIKCLATIEQQTLAIQPFDILKKTTTTLRNSDADRLKNMSLSAPRHITTEHIALKLPHCVLT